MNRCKIKKKRIDFKIRIAVPRLEKYKIGEAVETIRFIYFRAIHLREVSQICDDSFTRGQPLVSASIRDWSRAYSFIYRLDILKILIRVYLLPSTIAEIFFVRPYVRYNT